MAHDSSTKEGDEKPEDRWYFGGAFAKTAAALGGAASLAGLVYNSVRLASSNLMASKDLGTALNNDNLRYAIYFSFGYALSRMIDYFADWASSRSNNFHRERVLNEQIEGFNHRLEKLLGDSGSDDRK